MNTVVMAVRIMYAILRHRTKLLEIKQEVTKQLALQSGNANLVIIGHINIMTVIGVAANIALMVALMAIVTLHQATIRVTKQETTLNIFLFYEFFLTLR